MAEVLPGYATVIDALSRIMRNLPGVIVTIDGRDGVGKTTLGRYLAWHFNVTLVETDLFVIPTRAHPIYLDDQVNRIIERRLSMRRPIIVEGVSVLALMSRLSRNPDFAIYVSSSARSRSRAMRRRLSEYEAAFNPGERATLVVELDH
jgi:uridine kinase